MRTEHGGTNVNRRGEPPETVVGPDATANETSVTEEGTELERTIGLTGGLAIGVGTMIGAGIFVFPGLAAGRGGPAAAGSFAVGAVVVPLALLFGVLLTGLNLFGTENAAKLQSYVVGLLLAILVVFLGYGGLDALGVFGTPSTPEGFMPFGPLPMFTTAALVFTSYLGFAQVATVAGDIKRPGRNLPLAMVGSVLAVVTLYVATIFVATSAFGSAALSDFGETAIVEVTRAFGGRVGAVAILLAGLLATISSANASILSTSRAVLAVSKDALLPRAASRMNLKYGTPHVALTMAGAPTLALVALGEVEVLAKVASFLHLVMYGLICVALIAMRRDEPEWYDPDFRVLLYPLVVVPGALASFDLIAFMQPFSQAVGVAIMLATAGLYEHYASDVSLEGVL